MPQERISQVVKLKYFQFCTSAHYSMWHLIGILITKFAQLSDDFSAENKNISPGNNSVHLKITYTQQFLDVFLYGNTSESEKT